MTAVRLARIAAALLAFAPAAIRAADPPAPAAAASAPAPPPASTPPPPPRIAIRLNYIRAAGAQNCPPEQTLHDEVATRMGYDPFTPDASDRIVATLSRSARGLVATVERVDSKGVPQWDPKTYDPLNVSCAQLVRAMGIYISYRFLPRLMPPQASTPGAAPNSAPASSAPAVSSTSSPPPAPPQTPASPPSPRASPPQSLPSAPPRAFLVELGLSPLVAFGVAPRPAFAGALHVGLRWPSFSIAAEVRADAPASAVQTPAGAPAPSMAAALPSATLGTLMLGGSVVPSWHVAPFPRWPQFFFMTGGVLTAAAVLGHIEELPATKQDLYVGAGPRVGVSLRLGSRFIASLYGDAVVSIKPARATIGGMEVWRTRPVSGDIGGAFRALF